MKKTIMSAVLFVLALAMPAWAAGATMKLPLYKFAPVSTVDMRCVNAEYTIPIPIPERWHVKKATLTVSYMNSASLMLDSSQLSIWMNKQPITQRKFSSLVQKGTISVPIAETFLRPGYNELGFKVAQHYQKECEKPCSSELWTTLYLDTAFIEIEYDLRPVPLSIASVAGFMFDPKATPQGNVNVIMEDGSADTVTIASIVTSGIARRFDYKKVYFTVTKDILPGVDNVIVGKKAFMDRFLKSKGVEHGEITGPFLKVAHLPVGGKADRTHGLLILSGRQYDDLKLASETISNLTISYPGTDEMIATKFTLPEIAKYGGRLMLTADKVYDFKSLNIPPIRSTAIILLRLRLTSAFRRTSSSSKISSRRSSLTFRTARA